MDVTATITTIRWEWASSEGISPGLLSRNWREGSLLGQQSPSLLHTPLASPQQNQTLPICLTNMPETEQIEDPISKSCNIRKLHRDLRGWALWHTKFDHNILVLTLTKHVATFTASLFPVSLFLFYSCSIFFLSRGSLRFETLFGGSLKMIKRVICKLVKRRKIQASLSFPPPPPNFLLWRPLDALKSQSTNTQEFKIIWEDKP